MVVDYARVVLNLKAHILSKRSHGDRELLKRIAELEVESQIPEAEEGFDPTPPRPREFTAVPGVTDEPTDAAADSAAA